MKQSVDDYIYIYIKELIIFMHAFLGEKRMNQDQYICGDYLYLPLATTTWRDHNCSFDTSQYMKIVRSFPLNSHRRKMYIKQHIETWFTRK